MAFKYSDEHREFILNNYKGITTVKLAERFNARFNTNISMGQMRSYLKNRKLKNGVIKQFKKGHTPANKGTKGVSKPNKTSFKKGHASHNFRPIGSERVNVYGYIEIKTANPNTWELKQKVVYEKEFGKIPKGYAIFFLDQNKLNVSLDNLVLVSRQELLIINRELRFLNGKDVNQTKVLLAKIQAKSRNIIKNMGKVKK